MDRFSQRTVTRVFFFAPLEDRPDKTAYPHAVIALAEGLGPLGIEFYADRPYWRKSPESAETLFQYDVDVRPEECDVVLVDRDVLFWRQDLDPHALRLSAPKAILVLVAAHKDLLWLNLKQSLSLHSEFDLVLKSHAFQGMYSFSSNCVSWPFGFTQRQIDASAPQPEFDARQHVARVNIRHTQNKHSVRHHTEKRFFPILREALPVETRFSTMAAEDPYDDLMWRQTGRRHMSSYFRDLRHVKACVAFGGWFVPNAPSWPLKAFWIGLQGMKRTGMCSNRIAQWDSWRLWEAMICGAVPIHVDFSKYGMNFPEAPTNWTHYIGVDLDRPRDCVERLRAEPEILDRISCAGREWALRHYSPEAVGRRFLGLIGRRVE